MGLLGLSLGFAGKCVVTASMCFQSSTRQMFPEWEMEGPCLMGNK